MVTFRSETIRRLRQMNRPPRVFTPRLQNGWTSLYEMFVVLLQSCTKRDLDYVKHRLSFNKSITYKDCENKGPIFWLCTDLVTWNREYLKSKLKGFSFNLCSINIVLWWSVGFWNRFEKSSKVLVVYFVYTQWCSNANTSFLIGKTSKKTKTTVLKE